MVRGCVWFSGLLVRFRDVMNDETMFVRCTFEHEKFSSSVRAFISQLLYELRFRSRISHTLAWPTHITSHSFKGRSCLILYDRLSSPHRIGSMSRMNIKNPRLSNTSPIVWSIVNRIESEIFIYERIFIYFSFFYYSRTKGQRIWYERRI